MKIVHLVAGAGGMYCGSCMHANTLVAALQQAGHDALLVPLYTPLRLDEEDAGIAEVAFGGANLYLQQRLPWLRHAPRFLTGILDSPRLLRCIGSRSGSTRPESLGPLAVSMLRGEEGRQQGELARLARWLRDEIRPQVIHLSNAMLIGTARMLRREVRAPIVCSLSGEDIFLEKLPQPYYAEARAALAERSSELDGLVAMNRYYAQFMAEYLPVPRRLVHVVPPGLNLAGHLASPDRPQEKQEPGAPLTIGFLARVCPEKGLHLLAEAFRLLAADRDVPPTRLLAAGYLSAADRPYLDRIRTQITAWGLADRFHYAGEPDRAAKIGLLQSFDVMSLPTVYRESKGLPVLEAWANGVPVVVPGHGAFPELVEDTGGGLLFEPENAADLAATLKRMITDPDLAAQCGRRGWDAVHARYHAAAMAEQTVKLYQDLPDSAAGPGRE
jgi:glycosyltransferase involved in cell wall biosynthesis